MKSIQFRNLRNYVLGIVCFLSLVIGSTVVTAQQCIPAGATIDSAIIFLKPLNPTGSSIDLHRATAPWNELEVNWDNFAGNFDSTVEGTIIVDDHDWKSFDATSLVDGWFSGVLENYGVLLKQELVGDGWATFVSSEFSHVIEWRPKLTVCYTDGGSSCITIQQLDTETRSVWDAMIHEGLPFNNRGDLFMFYTGLFTDDEKQGLVRFEIETCPVAP